MSRDAEFFAREGHSDQQARITVLLEEYRALYGLVTFRLSAMDRRLPVAGGALWALLSSTTAMPPDTKLCFLLGLPAALLWLVRSTVEHAQSKEDHLRRIDEIERLVNSLAGEELLVFQSRHPNKRGPTAGRTGLATVRAVLSACVTMLAACTYLAAGSPHMLPVWGHRGYQAYVVVCGMLMTHGVVKLRRYRYRRPPPRERPVFEPHPHDERFRPR